MIDRIDKRKLLNFLKLPVGLLLAYVIIHIIVTKTGVMVWDELYRADRKILMAAVACFGFSIYLLVERLHMLCRLQDIFFSRWIIAKIFLISSFLSIVIPGAVSGDFIKAVYMVKLKTVKQAEIILTVFLDRVIGMIGLMFVTVLSVLYFLPLMDSFTSPNNYLKSTILIISAISLAGVTLFFIILMAANSNIEIATRIFNYLHSKLPSRMIPTIDKLMAALKLYRDNRRAVLKSFFISALNHIVFGFNLYLIGLAVHEKYLGLMDYILTTQLSNIATVIPVTPAGLGVRDVSTVMVVLSLGGEPEKAGIIPVIMTLIILFWRLIGGWFFIFPKFSRKYAGDRSEKAPANLE
jgi:uncharacterized protein (TIRG00374 family)